MVLVSGPQCPLLASSSQLYSSLPVLFWNTSSQTNHRALFFVKGNQTGIQLTNRAWPNVVLFDNVFKVVTLYCFNSSSQCWAVSSVQYDFEIKAE
ncbi:hypothetical protein J4Q44_G00070210 [Coregonus suidteri]|uniref:Uncharacterized protein n=1 Tax=Coregonus suidteri TaxID=861788 RepID=A0AAN8M4A2_9TELE